VQLCVTNYNTENHKESTENHRDKNNLFKQLQDINKSLTLMLKKTFETSGNKLFRYRGQIPVILFIAAIPVIYFTDYSLLTKHHTLFCILTLAAVLVSFSGIFIRAYTIGTTPIGTSGRNRDKQVAAFLNKTGIYSVVRHPLYLGNYLIWLGLLIFTFNIYFIILASLAFWLFYERIMYAEECFLEMRFGEDFRNWSYQTPAFFPSFKNYSKSHVPFSFKSVLRREYSGLLAVTISYVFIDLLRYYFINKSLDINRFSICSFIVILIVVLVIRTIKHSTKLLDEEDRS
jgi:protein-S-isoprenylcysteine O-methyltransferase Ste14